jgi:nucleoid DNA-binding protein
MTSRTEAIDFIARSTGLNESGVRQALLELRDAVISFNKQGRAVKLDGLGTYTPAIDLAGTIKVSHRADKALKNAVNAQGAFRGEIINRENIGKTGDDLVAMWNADNPGDVVS